METKHVIKSSSGRDGVCIVTEHFDRIALRFSFSRYGELNDEVEIMEWLFSIFDKFEGDPRPVNLDNELAPDSNAAVAASFGKLKLVALNIALGE